MSDSYVKHLVEERQKAWHAVKELLDNAAAEKRELTAEEEQSWQRMNDDLDRRAAQIDDIKKTLEREAQVSEAVRGIESVVRPAEVSRPQTNDVDTLRALARGDIRSALFEQRTVTGASTGAPVPTAFYDQIIDQARLTGPMLRTSTIINTASGENLQIPSLSSWSTATIATASQAIGTSDPGFNSFVTLGAYKISFLTQMSRELLTDAGVDVASFFAQQAGNAIGYAANTYFTTGTGTVVPNGLVAKSVVGGTTAGTATIAGDDLISLVYSLDGAARLLPNCGFQMNGNTIAAVRKLKASTSGVYLFAPTLDVATPDTLLGYPVYENPAMANVASASKSVIFGHLPSYYIRQVGGIEVARSDDFAFSTDLATFRVTYRADGNLLQTSHVKHLLTL